MNHHPLPAGIPSIEQTPHSRSSLVATLGHERDLPDAEIAVATLYADVIEPDIVATLERAQREDLDVPSERLLFRGIHILGSRRFPAAYRPLLAFLRGPQDRVERLLGAAVTENLAKILCGLFDGDEQPLRNLILDADVNQSVREAALKALAFLAFEGLINRTAFEAFLLRFDEERLVAADDDVMWHGWMTAVAVLGVTALVPRARAALADGRIVPEWCAESDFDALLQAAIERPDDRTRLTDERMGYIDDVQVALEKFSVSEDDDIDSNDFWDVPRDWLNFQSPARNPYRDVGRNDPCPCGSGKKFKKCCLRE